MQICLAAMEYAPDQDLGGIGAYTRHLSVGLQQLGHSVTILSRELAQPALEFRKERLRGQWSRQLPKRSVRLLAYSLALAQRIRRSVSQKQLEIVEVPDWGAEGLALSLRKPLPLVVRLHTPSFVLQQFADGSLGIDQRLVNWLEKKAILGADLIASPSVSLAQIVAQQFGIPLQRIHLLRYPIDTKLFSPAADPSHAHKTVLYVGRLQRRKGVYTLARAIPIVARACPQVEFLLVGPDMPTSQTGPTCKEELLKILIEYGVADRVRFLPRQGRTSLAELYRASDVCVVPSLYDNLPFACLEAMASGKAVVASDAGGLSEIIHNDINGRLVPAGQAEPLAEALIGLLDSKPQRQRLGQHARAYIEENFSCDKIAQATVQMYQQIIGKS